MDVLLQLSTSVAPPVIAQFTWAQEPVRFEDPFGRVLPVPSEYDLAVRRQTMRREGCPLTTDQP